MKIFSMKVNSMDHAGAMMTINRVRLIIVLSFCLAIAGCKSDNRQITSDMIHFPSADGSNENAPMIAFDSAICRFGTLAIGEKFTHTFHFTNTGKSPLLITQVNPSCGCTTPKDWPQQPIAPGEEGHITVEFNSNGNSGQVDKSVSVLTNSIPSVWVLRLQGTVIGTDVATEAKHPVQMEMEIP
jgi:hypothetical protein